MTSNPSYPDYRDSGIDWFGPIPAHWRVKPLWTMYQRIKDTGHPEEMMLSVFRDYGVVEKESRANLNVTADNRNIYQLVHPGWLVTNRMKAWQGSVGISTLRGIVSGHYICFEPRHDEDHRYLNWLFRSERYTAGYHLISRGVRVGQAEIDNDDYRVMPVVLPPLGEQGAIANFLEQETAKIDVLITKQQRLIELLGERRSAVPERILLEAAATSTQGARLKHVVLDVTQGWSPECHAWPADGVTTWAVLKAGCANRGVFRPSENKELPPTEEPRPSVVVRAGQLVVSRANSRELVGSAAVVEGEFPRLMLSDKLYAFTLDTQRALPRYVAYVMNTARMRGLIELEATGTSPSMQNVSQADLLNLPLELPPVASQHAILAQLDAQTTKIDRLIAKAQRAIELAKERRAALITAAVTGQIDVRGKAA